MFCGNQAVSEVRHLRAAATHVVRVRRPGGLAREGQSAGMRGTSTRGGAVGLHLPLWMGSQTLHRISSKRLYIKVIVGPGGSVNKSEKREVKRDLFKECGGNVFEVSDEEGGILSGKSGEI